MIRIICLFLCIFTLLLPNISYAEETLDLSHWKTLPILHEGRIKPLDSFARITLKTFSEKDHIKDISAAQWLADTVFLPESAMKQKLFKGQFTAGERTNYSYEELATYIQSRQEVIPSLLEKNSKALSLEQAELLRLYENFIIYTQILRAMTGFIIPVERQEKLQNDLQKIISQKGNELDNYTAHEKEIAAQVFAVKTLAENARNNILFRVIPDGDQWLSPWSVIQNNMASSTLHHWQDMAQAYRAQDKKKWKAAIKKTGGQSQKLKAEIIFNMLALHHVATFLYGLTIICFLLSCFFKPVFFEKSGSIMLIFGVLLHLTHMILRIYILGRPPIGTLYESILFVALICAASFAVMAWKQKNINHILLGGVSGLVLLLTAEAFAAEDTMGTLVAVLNTNFWLATHVVCITMGYAACLLTAITSHYYLLLKALDKKTKEIFITIKTLSLLSLLLVIVGTILGGLWADQSWGRFWGWDPKENGALLITLWLIWLLHGQLTNHINRTGFVMGMAFLSVVVVLAWFGVNLLNVGLHSYGFISGVSWGIGIFCTLEIILIGGLWLYPKRNTA